jgi:sugar phosphate permease
MTRSAALSPPLRDRPTQVRWQIFALTCAASWILYLHRYSWGVIKPALRRENPSLTDAQWGWLDAAFNATYALGQVPCGLAGDLFGARAVLTPIILCWSLLVAGLTLAHGFWAIFAIRSLFGAAQAGAYPILSKVTRAWFPLAIRTSVQGSVTAFGRVGGACSPLIVATLLMGLLGFSWQNALVTITVPGVVLAVAFWLAFRNSPREHPWSNAAEQQAILAGEPPLQSGALTRLRWNWPNGINLGLLSLYAFASSFADMLYVFWIPSFLIEGKGLTDTQMGLFAPLPLLGGAMGSVVGGMLNDLLIRITGKRRIARSSVAFTGKLLAAGLIALSIHVLDGRLVMLILLACKFFGDWSLPTQWGTVTDISGSAAASIFAVVNTAGSIGAFAAGPAMGYLKQYHGWEGLFLGVAGVYLAAALTWLFIDCTRRLAGPV